MSFELSYTTRLETVSSKDDVQALLQAKLDATSAISLVDYIALADDHIDNNIKELAKNIKILQGMKKDEELRRDFLKEEGATFLDNNGVKKLEGQITSSITVSESKPQENLIIENEEALINSGFFVTTIDKKSIKEALLSGVEVEGARIEVVHLANKIRINKKR